MEGGLVSGGDPYMLPAMPQEARCSSCGVEAFQDHLDNCSLGQGLYIPSWMRAPPSPDQMGLVNEIKRIKMLPESKRKHRRIRRLLLRLEPEYYKHLKADSDF